MRLISLAMLAAVCGSASALDGDRIQPYTENPHYWQYKGEPVLLLGGTVEDNLFQIANLEVNLDLLKSVGGNYVRCTMSSRDPGNVWPFAEDDTTGLYDLNEWDDEYWRRFERLLQLTKKREIIPQVEIWATYDFYRPQRWGMNPWNPKNNINYTSADSGLTERVDYDPWARHQPFFETAPQLKDNKLVLQYQQRFVEKLLSISLRYNHLLYGIDNESNNDPKWVWYWAGFVLDKAKDAGVEIELTQTWDKWDPTDGKVGGVKPTPPDPHPFWQWPQETYTVDHPELFSFVDISNHNTQQGQIHWQTGQYVRNWIERTGKVRPINCVKIYGGPANMWWCNGPRDGTERFWRNIIGGLASSRFHRPPAGIGLNADAQAHIKSMRMLLAEFDIFGAVPDSKSTLLKARDNNEAFLTHIKGEQYAVYFPYGGSVALDLTGAERTFEIKWLDIKKSVWTQSKTIQTGNTVTLQAPSLSHWVALLKSRN